MLGKEVKNLSFIVNVGLHRNKTFVANPSKPGCHWIMLYFNLTKNTWHYCDTLGWVQPNNSGSSINAIKTSLWMNCLYQGNPYRKICWSQTRWQTYWRAFSHRQLLPKHSSANMWQHLLCRCDCAGCNDCCPGDKTQLANALERADGGKGGGDCTWRSCPNAGRDGWAVVA